MHPISICLAVLLPLGFVACGGSATQSAVPTTAAPTTAESTTTTVEDVANPEETGSQGADDGEIAEDSSSNRAGSETALCTAAPESTTFVVTLPPWSDGAQRTLEVQSGRQDTSGGFPPDLILTPVHLTVEASADDGWRFLWDAGPTLLDDLRTPQLALDQLTPLLAEVPRERIRYRLSEDRVWLEVDNPDEIRQAALDTLDLISPWLSTMDPATFSTDSVAQARELFATMPDEDLAQLFSQRPQLLHELEGIEIAVDAAYKFSGLLPNPFGGGPFPATTTIEVVDLIDEDSCVAIEMSVVPDPEDFARIAAETLRQTLATEEELRATTDAFELETLVVGQYDHGSGFFRRLTATERVSFESEEIIETTIITDVTED